MRFCTMANPANPDAGEGLGARTKRAAGKAATKAGDWVATAASAVSGVGKIGGVGGTDMHPGAPTGYELYMRTEELLKLQKEEDKAVHHDELMFQVVHQSFELWCKLVLFELKTVGRFIEEDRLIEAYPLIQRCTHAIKVNTESMHA
ncbi:MAG TPA: tryptophan 2,3-dioxygenase family protein, partial [Candidatus Thermoplasmatota archaeon]|nr:tryptophan 2,3-dioxygenase family protein [Candidatus Thermoplasmatota archaeon]